MNAAIARPTPRRVRAARTLLAGVAVAHAIAILVAVGLRGVIADGIQGAQPSLHASELDALVALELVQTISFHALLLVVCGVYAARIGSGSRRVLRIVTASQVLSVLFGTATVITGSDAVRWLAPPFVAAALVILVILLGSAEARAFFAGAPRSRRSASAPTWKPPAP